MSETVRAFALDRHRIGIDGVGVTSLLTLHGCPLRCKYCINPQCNEADCPCAEMTAESVVQYCMKDNLYFLATGGGITVGGGEPLLHPRFITELRAAMPEEWKLNIETSLNVPLDHVRQILPLASVIIIDIKDMNPDIYQSYTERTNTHVLQNLRYIADQAQQTKCTIRLPLIPSFNTPSDRERSKERLSAMGFTNYDEFDYVLPEEVGK